MVLGTFAETKVPRLPGRTPATQKRMLIGECDKTMSAMMNQPKHIKWNILRAIPIHMIWRSGQNHKFHMIRIQMHEVERLLKEMGRECQGDVEG